MLRAKTRGKGTPYIRDQFCLLRHHLSDAPWSEYSIGGEEIVIPEVPTCGWGEGRPCEVVGRMGALISMHQMYLSSYVVQERCIEIAISSASLFPHQGRLRRLVISGTGGTGGAMTDA